jgi:iron(III) transport system permease protein
VVDPRLSRRRGSSTAPSNEAGLNWRADFYSLPDLIVMLGIYYNPYVYMFTGSALCNMEPSLEQAAESSGASAFSSLFTLMFPLTMPAIVSGKAALLHCQARHLGRAGRAWGPGQYQRAEDLYPQLTNWSEGCHR